MMRYFIAFLLFCAAASCTKDPLSEYPMEKRYWTPEDYDQVIRKIHYTTPDGQRFPEFSNSVTAPVIKKLVDHQNFLVVLEDEKLGLSHRSNVAQQFFDEYKDLVDAYYKTNREDKFVYGDELIASHKFGLELQIHYFKLGNESIKQEADDPDSKSTLSTLRSNEETIFKNFNNYLDFVNKESYFTDDQLKSYSDGIDLYFQRLYSAFPDANRAINLKKAQLMYEKSENEQVQLALKKLISNIQ